MSQKMKHRPFRKDYSFSENKSQQSKFHSRAVVDNLLIKFLDWNKVGKQTER